MKAYADITLACEPLPPEYSKLANFGQLWRRIATPLSKNAYHARSIATSSIKRQNNSTPYFPHGPLQSGEWTSSALFPGKRPSEIFNNHHRLLHQMNTSQIVSHHHNSTSPAVCLERYHMPLWRAIYDHNR